MFHQGTLQSGITRAIQEQKLVACFVRDDSATSHVWEEEWLKSGWLSALLVQKAVVLRLDAGSTEAGFLAAFSDVSSVPTFVVIQNGQLRVQMKSDVTKEEFVNTVRGVLGADPIPGSGAVPGTSITPEAGDETRNVGAEDDLYGSAEHAVPAPSVAAVPAPTPSSNAKGKQRATETNPTAPSAAASKAQQEARDALRKKKREDAEELARIKARIEADKAARKAAASLRKAEREQQERNGNASQSSHVASPPPSSATATTSSSRGSNAKIVALNVRLFDGRTIRASFPRTATLQADVRSWIDAEFEKLAHDDENLSNKHLPPYFFRHILAPSPSRELSAGDETVPLGDIDLAPSATLVLVPVKGYTDAYSGSASGSVSGITGAATGIVGGAFGLLSSTVGLVGRGIGSVMGFGGQQEQEGQHQGGGGRTVGSGSGGAREQMHDPVLDPVRPASGTGNGATSMRVRTLADQRAREPQQFYNGNQLSTEPRVEEGEKRD